MTSDLQKIELAEQRLKLLIQEAHGATKSLKAMMVEAKDIIHADVENLIQRHVDREIKNLAEQLAKIVDGAQADIMRRFDNVTELLLGGPENEPTLEEMMKAAAVHKQVRNGLIPPAFRKST